MQHTFTSIIGPCSPGIENEHQRVLLIPFTLLQRCPVCVCVGKRDEIPTFYLSYLITSSERGLLIFHIYNVGRCDRITTAWGK